MMDCPNCRNPHGEILEMEQKADISGFRIWQCAECKTIEVEELEAQD